MSHMCKRIFKFELQLSSYWQNIKFSRHCPKIHIFPKIVILQVYLQLLDQLLHTYKFYGRDMPGILFFIFANCEPLNQGCEVNCLWLKNTVSQCLSDQFSQEWKSNVDIAIILVV